MKKYKSSPLLEREKNDIFLRTEYFCWPSIFGLGFNARPQKGMSDASISDCFFLSLSSCSDFVFVASLYTREIRKKRTNHAKNILNARAPYAVTTPEISTPARIHFAGVKDTLRVRHRFFDRTFKEKSPVSG